MKKFFPETKFALSNANVEKVVNPPQTPVLRKSTTSGLNLTETFCAAKEANAVTMPIAKQPSIFTTKVWNGKTLFTGISVKR